jgi:hypothetical protein
MKNLHWLKTPLILQKLPPRAAQRLLDSYRRRHEHVNASGLDLLDGADVQVNQFGQAFLGDFLFHPLTADVCSDTFQSFLDHGIVWHALLGRFSLLTKTAQWGVIEALQ